jgi:hypothetical protein
MQYLRYITQLSHARTIVSLQLIYILRVGVYIFMNQSRTNILHSCQARRCSSLYSSAIHNNDKKNTLLKKKYYYFYYYYYYYLLLLIINKIIVHTIIKQSIMGMKIRSCYLSSFNVCITIGTLGFMQRFTNNVAV